MDTEKTRIKKALRVINYIDARLYALYRTKEVLGLTLEEEEEFNDLWKVIKKYNQKAPPFFWLKNGLDYKIFFHFYVLDKKAKEVAQLLNLKEYTVYNKNRRLLRLAKICFDESIIEDILEKEDYYKKNYPIGNNIKRLLKMYRAFECNSEKSLNDFSKLDKKKQSLFKFKKEAYNFLSPELDYGFDRLTNREKKLVVLNKIEGVGIKESMKRIERSENNAYEVRKSALRKLSCAINDRLVKAVFKVLIEKMKG